MSSSTTPYHDPATLEASPPSALASCSVVGDGGDASVKRCHHRISSSTTFFGSLRGGEGEEGDEVGNTDETRSSRAAVPMPAAPPPTVTVAPRSEKLASRIPKSLWYFAGNNLWQRPPTITHYTAVESTRKERYTEVHRQWAADQAQKAVEKAKRKDALKCEGGLTGFILGGRRKKQTGEGGGNVQAGLRGGRGRTNRISWSHNKPWTSKRSSSEHNAAIADVEIEFRGGGGESRIVYPETRLPKHLCFFAGGRGPAPTVRGWNQKCRQRKKRDRIRPGAAGEFLGMGDWGLSEEGKQVRKEGWKRKLRRLLNGGND